MCWYTYGTKIPKNRVANKIGIFAVRAREKFADDYIIIMCATPSGYVRGIWDLVYEDFLRLRGDDLNTLVFQTAMISVTSSSNLEFQADLLYVNHMNLIIYIYEKSRFSTSH